MMCLKHPFVKMRRSPGEKKVFMPMESNQKKSLLIGFTAYVLWGVLPLFWHLLDRVDPLAILANRIIWSAVFSVAVLLIQGRAGEIRATMRDKRKMRWLIPSALIITFNWGLYIWAVNRGHVLDASLGYYMNPLVAFALGIFLFKEKCGVLEIVAVLLAAVGVGVSTVSYGAFPWIALLLAVSFAVYGAVKKQVHIDAVTGIAVETLLTAPFAILFLLLSDGGHALFASLTVQTALLLLAAGPITAAPLMMFAYGVNGLPLSTMGFIQFICPTLIAITGVVWLGETLTQDKLIAFAFILAALVLYLIGLLLAEKKARKMELS